MTQETNEYRENRERKRDALIELGVNPYEVRTPERAMAQGELVLFPHVKHYRA